MAAGTVETILNARGASPPADSISDMTILGTQTFYKSASTIVGDTFRITGTGLIKSDLEDADSTPKILFSLTATTAGIPEISLGSQIVELPKNITLSDKDPVAAIIPFWYQFLIAIVAKDELNLQLHANGMIVFGNDMIVPATFDTAHEVDLQPNWWVGPFSTVTDLDSTVDYDVDLEAEFNFVDSDLTVEFDLCTIEYMHAPT